MGSNERRATAMRCLGLTTFVALAGCSDRLGVTSLDVDLGVDGDGVEFPAT